MACMQIVCCRCSSAEWGRSWYLIAMYCEIADYFIYPNRIIARYDGMAYVDSLQGIEIMTQSTSIVQSYDVFVRKMDNN